MKIQKLLLFIGLFFAGCTSSEQEEQAMIKVFKQYQAALEQEDPAKLLQSIDSGSREYLLTQLEYLKENNQKAVQSYITKSRHPVMNVDMIARALNYYQGAQVDSLSAEAFLKFDLGYLIDLEKPVMEGYEFREKVVVNDQKGILKFARLLADGRNMVADIEFLKEEEQWTLNLQERMDVQEINARALLKTMDQNTWKYVEEKLDRYY